MNVIHVFPFFSISRGGGTTWLITEIAKGQTKYTDVRPSIHSGSYEFDSNLENEVSKFGVKVKISKSFLNNLNIFIMPGLVFSSFKYLKNVDVIHFHLFRSYQNIIFYFAARILKKPYIIDAHGSLPRHFKKKKFKKFFFDVLIGNKILKNAKFFIAENELSLSECVEFGVPKEKVKIIRPPFPVKDFKNIVMLNLLENKYNISKSKKKILFVGRLHKIKGVDLIINGFYELSKRQNDIHLIIMGPDEGELSYLKNLVFKYNLGDKVTFTGFIGGNDKLSIIKECDICIQSSLYEQGAGVPFESVLCGTPILVSDNSGAAMDVRRINAGILFNHGNSIDLALKIEYIFKNYIHIKNQTIIAAKKINEELSFENATKNYTFVYNDCIN